MKYVLLASLVFGGSLYAYSDSDLDGVEDRYDQCPGTPLSDLVGSDGCTVRSLASDHRFDIVAGVGFSQLNYASNAAEDTATTTLQADYYYKNFSTQVVASRFSSDSNSGANDTLIAAHYQLPALGRLYLKVGAGVLLPTYTTGYSNEAADYMGTVSASYFLDPGTAMVGGYTFTAVNDTNVPGILSYQNTHAWYAGLNHTLSDTLSLGAAYHYSDSIYADVEAIEKASMYGMLRFDAHWFANAAYAYGLSDSASNHAIDLRVGYYF